MNQLSPHELSQWLQAADRTRPQLLDVREHWEAEICRIGGAALIPMSTIPQRIAELETTAPIVVICHHGVRSLQVALFLARAGFTEVHNLQGGMAAWAEQVDPAMARY